MPFLIESKVVHPKRNERSWKGYQANKNLSLHYCPLELLEYRLVYKWYKPSIMGVGVYARPTYMTDYTIIASFSL